MTSQLVIYVFYHLIPLVAIWLAIVREWIPLLQYGPDCDCFRHLVYFAPIYGIVALGVYALFSVVYGVSTFNNCREAREELVREIKEARADLKRRKVID